MKSFFQFIFSKLFLKHLLLAVVAFVVLIFLTLQLLKVYTKHGNYVEVPDVRGLNIMATEHVLKENRLSFQIIDSIFVANRPLGTVLEQVPHAGSKVKTDRDIYLTINTRTKKRVPLPDVQELSYRQARAMIEAVGLKVEKVERVPAEFDDLVIGVKFKFAEVTPGTRIEIGSGVTLLVSEASNFREEENSFNNQNQIPPTQDGGFENFFQ